MGNIKDWFYQRRNDMKVNELESVLFSSMDNIQSVIIYSRTEHKEIEKRM